MSEPPRDYFTLGRNSSQIIRDGSFATRKEHLESSLFNHHIAENNIRIQGLLRKLHAAYIHQKIPDFYGYFFLGQIANTSEQRMADSIDCEMQLLKNKQCHYISIMRTLNARESCLKSVQRCLESVFQDSSQPLLATFKAEIGHYRQLTALVIEQIQQWKEYLLGINPTVYGDGHIAFFFQGNDYLFKILGDTDFIGQSFLSSKVTFSYKQDPFLLRPYTESQTEANPYLQLFKYEPDERDRYVKALQFLAEERADYLKRKITVREERIREIQKAYQSKIITNRILLTKPQISFAKKQKDTIFQTPIDFIQEPRNSVVSKESKRSGSLSDLKESKMKDFLIKGQKIRKIREMKIGEPPTLINPKMFSTIEGAEQKEASPIIRSVSLGFLKRTSPFKKQKSEREQQNTDFQSMLREKELKIMQLDIKKRKTFSSVRLNDRLSERKTFIGQEGAEELRKILQQLDHASPQQEEGFLKKRIPSGKPQQSMLQHNEEAMLSLRKSVLKQIQDHESHRERQEQQKRDEREQMQRIIQEKLDKQTLLDIQKQKNRWVQGKDLLAHQLGKKELFGYSQPFPNKSQKLTEIQLQLKKEMQLKWLREVRQELSHRQAMISMSKQQEKTDEKRQKELQIAKGKLQQQKRFEDIQKEEKLKAMSKQIEKEDERKREIELQMEEVVQREKFKLQSFSQEQKQLLQQEMKEAMKVNLLTQLKREKSQYTSEIRAKQAKKLKEQAHRAEVRRKIETEFQIEQQLQRQREREDKRIKIKLVAQKMQHIQQQLDKDKVKRENSVKTQEEMASLKRSLTSIPDPRSSQARPVKEENKKKLREEFQLQLFSFNREKDTLQDNFFVKDFKNKIEDEDNLNARMAELQQEMKQDQEDAKKQQQLSQKIQEKGENFKADYLAVESLPPKDSSLKAVFQKDLSSNSDKFMRFSSEKSQKEKSEPTITETDLKKIGIDMSPIEYMMYIKKKAAIDAKKIAPLKEEEQKKRVKRILDEFQIMQNLSNRIKAKQQTGLMIQNLSENQHQQKSEKRSIPIDEINTVQLEEKKESKKIQKKPKDAEELSELMRLTVHSKISPKRKKRFVTSEDSSVSSSEPKKTRKKSKKVEAKIERGESVKQMEVIQNVPPAKSQDKEMASFKGVEEEHLETYLIDHFKKLSKLSRKLNLFKKDELLKMILQAKSTMIVQVSKGEYVEGAAFISQNQNKKTARSLNILHLGAYSHEKTIDVLLKARDLVFSIDPCAELTYSMYYQKEDKQQTEFIKQFEKRFDPYGAIFQKKINNEQIERKHVMRRMIGELSEKPLIENRITGQIKISSHLLAHSCSQDLGVELGLRDLGTSLGGWTQLSLFLSKYGDQEQISEYLNSDVKQENKNIKYISKMAMKLKANTVRDIDYFQFGNPFEANLKLIEEKADILKCDPQVQQRQIPIKWMRLSLCIQPILPFVSTTATIQHLNDSLKLNYLRFKCGKGSKVVKLKSSLYSSQLIVIPCKPSNYKLMVMEASELDSLKKDSLDLYLKLFLANVDKHTLAADEHIWIPQFVSERTKEIALGKSFGFQNEIRSKAVMDFTEYIPNCINYSPNHKDVLVTPPFIMAVLNSEVERLVESSPIYIERIDLDQLTGLEILPKPAPQSDF